MINVLQRACRATDSLCLSSKAALVGLFSFIGVEQASAHVKWFCAYDVAGAPRGLENVLCPDFELLIGIAMLALLGGCLVEKTEFGALLTRGLDRVTAGVRANTEMIFRATCGFLFVSLWATGGIILTPELKTSSPAIPLVQLAMAAGLLSRQTMPFTAGGIVFLFGFAIYNYGLFHLADYPIFLGIAAYLALTGLQKDFFGIRPLDIVRYATAVTLMWASVEKWAFPEWTFPLFVERSQLTLGFDTEFYMRAAGVIEFALAFALLWTPLARRISAILLAAMFIAACFEFGKIDLIGHSGIIAVLIAIIADDRVPLKDRRTAWLAPAGFGSALAATLVAYYVGHAALFGTDIAIAGKPNAQLASASVVDVNQQPHLGVNGAQNGVVADF